MWFYKHFISSEDSNISSIWKQMINFQNSYILKLINKFWIRKKKSILEIGPWKGYFATFCKKNNLNYTAIEWSKTLYNNLKKDFKVYNKFVPPLDVNWTFDIIYMNQVFEHMDNKNQATALLEECHKKLKDNWLIIIATPDYVAWKEDFFVWDYTHSFPTSMRRLEQIFCDNDFSIIYKNYYTFFVRWLLLSRIISIIARFSYNIWIFHVLFWKKAYKIKAALLNSIIIIWRKSGK